MSGVWASVDHDLCAGVMSCMAEAPQAFLADDEGQSVYNGDGTWSADVLRKAAEMCPMAAITVVESD